MIHGVIFDMDGLMFDTERVSKEAWFFALKKYGHAQHPRCADFVQDILGMNRQKIGHMFETYFGTSDSYEEIYALRTSYIDEQIRTHGVPVKPGLSELLTYLQETHIPAALATSTLREKALSFLRQADVYPYFSAYVCGDMVTRSKPDPEIFLRAAAALNIPAGECLVLEDSPSGLLAGLAAGCHVIGVPDLAVIPADIYSKLDAVCASLLDVAAWLKENAH